MIKRLSVLAFLAVASLSQSNEVLHQISLKVVDIGENVTLHCPVSQKEKRVVHWYKQSLGNMPQQVATGGISKQKPSEQFTNNRFKLTEGDSQSFLTINDIIKEDEATYFCQSGTSYFWSFDAWIYLAVNNCNMQTQTHVRQTPEMASVQKGGTVNLHCSLLSKTCVSSKQCPAKYDVYWFRVGFGASHSSFIYRHKNSSDSQQRSCVYKLSKTIQNASDTGTYYCAVITCGRILFGEGTKVQTSSHLSLVVLVLGVLLGCCVTLIIALIVYINQTAFGHFKEANKGPSGRQKSSGNQRNNTDAHGDEVSYVALNFPTRTKKGVKKRTESATECVYSGVRAAHPTLHEMC